MKEKERMFDKNNMTLKLEKRTMSQVSENQMLRNELSKKRSLQEKGITLIALVVTIIILLILAGVTLNMALSQNGLFSKTQEAADKYKKAQEDEELEIEKIEYAADGIDITKVETISDKESFVDFREQVNRGENFESTLIKLSSDINLSEETWEPIGDEENPFAGVFDGKGHKITGLELNNSDNEYEGLFGYNTGIIKNVTIESAQIKAVKVCGTVCGVSNGKIENCHNVGNDITCNSASFMGGIVGETGSKAIILNCSNSCNITIKSEPDDGSLIRSGGIVGFGSEPGGIVEYCFNKGKITVTSKSNNPIAGGIAGENVNIISCYNKGDMSATLKGTDPGCNNPTAGGIVGQITNGSLVKTCYNIGRVTNKGDEGIRLCRKGYITGLLFTGGKLEDCFYKEVENEISGYVLESGQEGKASNIEKIDDAGEWKDEIIKSSEDKFKLSGSDDNPILYWE